MKEEGGRMRRGKGVQLESAFYRPPACIPGPTCHFRSAIVLLATRVRASPPCDSITFIRFLFPSLSPLFPLSFTFPPCALIYASLSFLILLRAISLVDRAQPWAANGQRRVLIIVKISGASSGHFSAPNEASRRLKCHSWLLPGRAQSRCRRN